MVAACRWADAAQKLGNGQDDCIAAYERAFTLLPEVVWLGKSVANQYADLARWNTLATQAANIAIYLGQYQRAVEWLEQGRSITWNQLLQLRTPLDELQSAHPVLSDELKSVFQHLEMLSHDREKSAVHNHMTMEQIGQFRRRLAMRRDELVQEVRTLPGFKDFLRAKPFSELLDAANDSPVIYLVLDDHASCHADALILMPGQNSVIQSMHESLQTHLGGQTVRSAQNVSEHAAKLVSISGSNVLHMHDILSQLWNNIVNPIIQALELPIVTDHPPPHIWWCMTGPLTFLPIHAAGDYSMDEPGHKISDYMVSSYTPTLTALIKARQKAANPSPAILGICQTQALGYSVLPAVAQEWSGIEDIAAKTHSSTDSLHDSAATLENVLSKMQTAQWVHLACHGIQDSENSIESAFILHNDALKLSRIVQQDLDQADFAFLSACQTATGNIKLSDQAVHLAAGMLFAGFRSVIATMWSIRDEDGPEVARDVYAHLLATKDSEDAADALHMAVQNLRKKYPGTEDKDILAWAPFIHMGC
ncbi:CHAT domain-containing protein [Fomitopsis serialis]|uniref:CHAT domain-containing protein n=1 Tax=Fomitopsis serialis TaxID=139415 RepID=UPI002008C6CF|nr:CHAT domain-containing protein [Neoantrodia serialis]KAH9916901.1 CHAT domain-containing protein [Neoantrodia serialis]